MKKVCVLLADGFEEIEGLTVVDLLRRAKIYVDTVSIMDDYIVHGAHGINVQTEDLFDEVDFEEFDMVVLPGGMPGTLNLKEQEIDEIENSIPRKIPKLDYKLFKQLYDECIDKIIYGNFHMPNKPFGIMMNIYEDKFCVFEVWNIERSINKDIELDR